MKKKMTEMLLKQWVHEQAAAEDVSISAIYMRLYRGKYPKLKRRHVNERVVLVGV